MCLVFEVSHENQFLCVGPIKWLMSVSWLQAWWFRFCVDYFLFVSWVSCQIRKLVGCACARNARNVFPTTERERQVSDASMHHKTCITHVPWCMSGPLTFPVFPVHEPPAIYLSGMRPIGQSCDCPSATKATGPVPNITNRVHFLARRYER